MAKKKDPVHSEKESADNNFDDNRVSEQNKQDRLQKNYEKLIERLKKERAGLQNELNHEYREARRYVRENPEEGVLISFAGGIVLGYLLGKLGK